MNKPFKIFVSHKKRDSTLASDLIRILTFPCRNSLTMFSMADIPGGSDWRLNLKSHLQSSDMLFLLFTDSYADWSWCLYEAGFFEGLEYKDASSSDPTKESAVDKSRESPWASKEDSKRIVCIHPPNFASSSLPNPLANRQMVVAQKGEMERFLRKFYSEKNLVQLSETEIKQISTEVSGLFWETYHRNYGKHVQITIPSSAAFESSNGKFRIPDDASVEGDIGSTFGLTIREAKWDEVLRNLPKSSRTDWITDLAKEMWRAIHVNCEPAPIPSTYCCVDHNRSVEYHPEFYCADKSATGVKFSLLFAEQPRVAKPIGNFSDLIQQVINLIRDTPAGVRIKMLALTPALGFLAQTSEEFDLLKDEIEKHSVTLNSFA